MISNKDGAKINDLVSDGGYAMEQEAHERKYEAEQKCPPEVFHVETGHDGARQQNKEGIQHEGEKPEGEDRERKGQKYEDRSDDGVDESEDESGNESGAEASHGDAGQKVGGNQNGDGRDEPVDQNAHGKPLPL